MPQLKGEISSSFIVVGERSYAECLAEHKASVIKGWLVSVTDYDSQAFIVKFSVRPAASPNLTRQFDMNTEIFTCRSRKVRKQVLR